MAHEFETGLFVGRPAWHGLGNVLQNAPSINDAIIQSGLAWQAQKVPLFLGSGVRMDGAYGIMRDTDGAQLGVVGEDFTPLQNAEAFDFFRPIIDSGEATIEAAGSLRGGKRVWILAAVKGATTEVVPGDSIKSYVLLAHGHDGTLSIRAGFTTVRVVCQNTLSASLGGKHLMKLRHTKGATVNLEKAKEAFDFQRGELKVQADKFRGLAAKRCDRKNLIRYVREVLVPGTADNDATVRNVPEIVDMFSHGRGAELSRGTMWGAYNAVTEYLTHEQGRSADARVNNQWFGPGAATTARALEVAVAFAEHAPDVSALGRECYSNDATAKSDFAALLGRPSAIV